MRFTKIIFVVLFLFFVSLSLTACTVKIESLQISESTLSLNIGESKNLNFYFEPADKDPKLVWSSSNPSVATVSNGVVFGVAKGNATITVTYGDFTDSVQVNVISIQDLYQSIMSNLENVTQNLSEVSSSVVNAWHFAIWESDDYSYTTVVFYLYLETGSRITSKTQIVNAYNTAYGTSYDESMVGLMLQDDFSRTVNTVKQAYVTLGAFEDAQTKLNEVKNIIQSLDSSISGYTQFQNYYLKVKALYDALDNLSGNYTTFSTNINTLKSEIQSARSSVDFYVD